MPLGAPRSLPLDMPRVAMSDDDHFRTTVFKVSTRAGRAASPARFAPFATGKESVRSPHPFPLSNAAPSRGATRTRARCAPAPAPLPGPPDPGVPRGAPRPARAPRAGAFKWAAPLETGRHAPNYTRRHARRTPSPASCLLLNCPPPPRCPPPVAARVLAAEAAVGPPGLTYQQKKGRPGEQGRARRRRRAACGQSARATATPHDGGRRATPSRPRPSSRPICAPARAG